MRATVSQGVRDTLLYWSSFHLAVGIRSLAPP
jgi:hypothetical protein